MYCKNCGAQTQEDAKFCPSCGAQIKEEKVEQVKPVEQVDDYFYDEEPKQQAPRQFGYDDHLDHSKNMQVSKSAFKGKQTEVGTSGRIDFGNTKKVGRTKILPRLIIITVVIIIGYFASTMFGGCDNVCDIETSDLINYDTWEPVGPSDTFGDYTDEVFLTFKTDGYANGSEIEVRWYYAETGEYLFNDYAYTTSDDLNIVYFSIIPPNDGWDLGDYEVEIYVNSEYVDSAFFTLID